MKPVWLENASSGMNNSLMDQDAVEGWLGYLDWLVWAACRLERYIDAHHVNGEDAAKHAIVLKWFVDACDRVADFSKLTTYGEDIGALVRARKRAVGLLN